MIPTLLAALAGGLGSAARYALDVLLAGRLGQSWVRLLVINVSGSALLGLLTGLAAAQLDAPPLQMIVGAGFLGGYTTFSAASLATVRLAEQGRWPALVLSGLGMLLAAVGAAAAGLGLGFGLAP